ncbi:MAG: ABC transporter ATP-binding protein [Eubacteriales bacterium]|nr:ABC transporter ATP-binding protein [Eubacteriales bacterium]
MIEISHLAKKYGGRYAVRDLSVRIEAGQIYGFLGPNGAGKSTTMNIITGYLAPTSGEVKVDGFDIVKEPEQAKRKIGYLPELPPLYQEMTVDEYLKFAAELKKIPAQKRRESIEKAVDIAQLADVRKRLIANLSKGYKQRVGLAQAVLGDPEIIILDEPTVGLDPKQMIEMRELIRNLREHHTVILSSHILSEVSAVCDRILIISKGELVASDTPESLQERMQGAGQLEIEVKGSAALLRTLLANLEGAEHYSVTTKENGIVAATVTEKAGCDVREALFFALAEHRMPLLVLQKKTGSLEDIFLQLTEKAGEES